MLLVVEDAHWLDPATVELLGAIVDPLAAAGWLIVIARRPDTPALATHAVPLVLEPLTDADVGRLAATASGDRPLSDALLDAIVDRAGGNPLFAAQLARSTPDAGDAGDVGLPESAERVVGARIDVLPGGLRSRLRRASVFGGRVELDVLQDVIDDPDVKAEETWAPLAEFVQWSPTHVEFRHDLFRLAAYEGLSFAERSALHRRAADLLEERPGHARRRAGRALALRRAARGRRALGDTGRRRSRRGCRLRRRGPAAASRRRERQARRGAGRGADRASTPRWRTGYEMLGEVEAAERGVPPGDVLGDAGRADGDPHPSRVAVVPRRRPAPRPATGRRGAASPAPPMTPTPPTARRADRAALGDPGCGRRPCRQRRRRRVGRRRGAPARRDELRGEALMQLAFNADLTDDQNVEELLATAVPLLEQAGRHRDVAILHLNRGVTHMVRGRWPAALSLFELAADGFRRCGFVLGSLSTDANRGGLLLEQGHPVVAAELFEDVVRRAWAAGNPRKALFATASAHRARAWAGETDAAIEGLVECIQAHRDAGLDRRGGRARCLPRGTARARRPLRARRAMQATVVLPRLAAWSAQEVVVLTTRRLAAVAEHCDRRSRRARRAGRGARRGAGRRDATSRSPAASRRSSCAPRRRPETWAGSASDRCTALGVTWMPPVTFVRLQRAA